MTPRHVVQGPRAEVESEVAPDDPRVVSALEEYLDLLESGRPPDRDRFLSSHAEVSEVLARSIDGLRYLCLARDDFEDSEREQSSRWTGDRGAIPVMLGDFQIRREIGRGGMGLVFEAVQCSLGRRVALKVLPLAATLDPRQRLRFQNEAQAAAHLHHPNIVPVYSVGCEGDVPYYAMQFIDGRSLAAFVAERRAANSEAPTISDRPDAGQADTTPETHPRPLDPASREYARFIAGVGLQAARALDHAHGLGILHRDIKPANLMLDRRDNLWITDFGLARVQGDVELTATGDIVGTLRYMSPEQSFGRRAVVDGRSDVYSLGVTLYEVLTLTPAHAGSDRAELLRLIAGEEPVAPRRLVPTIPKDLETIILKAMAKDQGRRYATALELAEDLERFLSDHPIRAKRPTPLERATSWGRRHRGLVAAGLVAGMLVTIGLAVESVVVSRAYREQSIQRELAEDNLEVAMTALDRICLQVAEDRFARDPKRAAEDRDMIRVALACFDQLARQNLDNPRARYFTAQAYGRVGDIRARLGQREDAEEAYNEALARIRSLVEAYPDDLSYQHHLATALLRRGNLLRQMHRFPLAERALREVFTVRKTSGGTMGDVCCKDHQANALNDLGVLYVERHRYMDADRAFNDALTLQRFMGADRPTASPMIRQQMADTRNNLGALLLLDNRRGLAEEEFRGALKIFRSLTSASPRDPIFREKEAMSSANLGSVLTSTGRHRDAVEAYRHAIVIQSGLVDEAPNVPDYRHFLARSLAGLGRALVRSQSEPEAGRVASKALGILNELANSRESASPRRELSKDYIFLAEVFESLGQDKLSNEAHDRALQCDPLGTEVRSMIPPLLNNLAWSLATDPDPALRNPARAHELVEKALRLTPEVGGLWNTLGVVEYRRERLDEAVRAFESSMKLREGGDSFDYFFLAMIAARQGKAKEGRSWYDRAEGWMEAHMPADIELSRFRAEAATALRIPVPAPSRRAQSARLDQDGSLLPLSQTLSLPPRTFGTSIRPLKPLAPAPNMEPSRREEARPAPRDGAIGWWNARRPSSC